MSRPLDRFFYSEAKPAARSKATAKSAAKATTKSAAGSAAKSAAKPATASKVRSAARSTAKPATKPKARAAAPSTATPAAKSTTKRARGKRRRALPVAAAVPRLRILLIVIAVIFSLAAGKAFQVQALDSSAVAAEAADQLTVTKELPAFRGQILDRNGEPLAFTEDTVNVVASPKLIATNGRWNAQMTASDREKAAAAPPKIAALIAQYLGGEAADYLPKLTVTGAGSRYQLLKRQVPAATYRALSAAMAEAELVGLSSESAPTRSYPNGTLAANVVGFVNGEGKGASGLEYSLNSALSGTAGREIYESSPGGEKIPTGTNVLTPAVNGMTYQLTLDAGLQWQAEQLLAERVRKTKADSGSVIITNPKTGEILALATYPSYDPNDPSAAKKSNLGNRAVTDVYTPGSVQKTLTFATLLDLGLVRPTEVVKVPHSIKSGDHDIKDAWDHGTIKLYARGVLAKSSNVGTVTLARRTSTQTLHDYMVSFGLGAKTNLGLPGESSGYLPDATMPSYSRDGLAYGGSAFSVTLPQMAAAVGTIANGGVYNPPQLLASRTRSDGTVEKLSVGQPHRVVSTDAASEVLSMMEAMAQNTSSHVFDVPGWRVGAKTGTAQKLNKRGRVVGLTTSAISVAPIPSPQVLVYAVIDHPRRGASGSAVAGPLVQQLTSLALARYAVPQSRGKAPKLAVAP